MDIYVIPPTSELWLMHEGSRYFCLAQLYRKDEGYRKFFQTQVQAGKWVTLDNGTGDKDPISQDELFELTVDLLPSEVIPLDTLFNARETIRNASNFIEKLEKRGLSHKVEVFCCPQGSSFDEWVDCYVTLSHMTAVKTIGMSKLAIPWVVSGSTGDKNIARDRNVMFDYLKNKGLLEKQLHFLGSEGPNEYQHYAGSPYVRSTDSCVTILSAINGLKFDENYQRIPTPRNYFDLEMNSEQIALAKENISTFRSLIQNV